MISMTMVDLGDTQSQVSHVISKLADYLTGDTREILRELVRIGEKDELRSRVIYIGN